MRSMVGTRQRWAAWFMVVGLAGGLWAAGCGGSGNAFEYFLPPFLATGAITGGSNAPATSGRQTGGGLGTDTGGFIDPCTESQSRKFVRIAMRNQCDDYVHYFLILIAQVNSDTYPTGAVCPTDIGLYTSFGYISVPEGQSVPLGNYCVVGPALYYFHRSGQFRSAGGTSASNLSSAIGPAQGTTPTYDGFFTSAGATVPVPNLILFHNPGTTAGGQALKVSRNNPSPCATGDVTTAGDPDCAQDAFYYVDETDRITGSTALGVGSGRRVPGDIQGTGCECTGASVAFQELAPGTGGTNAPCNAFYRGGRIDYAFVREDTEPAYPQLLWRVTDSNGARIHDFDDRANIP